MSLKTRLGALFAALFGRLSWEAPAWSQRLWALIRSNRRVLLGVFALSAAGAGVYAFIVTRPPPPNEVRLSAEVRSIVAPARRTRADAVPAPATLIIQFDGSAAPLADINKAITNGVSIRPAIDGEWKWLNERTLGFTPKTQWPVGEKYKVSMAQQLVNRPNTVLATRELELVVEPFTVSVASFEFYQDPVDPSVKQVVGTFRFNYPVDPESFEKRLKLDSVPSSNKGQHEAHKYTVSYDDLRFEAYVRSENLPMPIEDHIATLLLTRGAKAAGSSSADETDHPATVIIPGKGSKFRVNEVQATIANSAEGDPDQVLVFTCSSTVNENVFAQAVKVWVLPKDKPATGDQAAVKNYGWSATEVGPEILKKSTRLKVAAIPGEHEVGAVQSFKIDIKPGSQLFVRVEPGIEAFGGYTLVKPFENVVVVPEYPREIKIAHDGSVLSVTGDKKLTVTARGIPAFKVHLFQIQPKDLNHLITQAAGDFAHLSMRNGSFSEENISEVFSEVHPLDASNPRVAQYAAVDFSQYLNKGAEQRGMYFVRVEAWNPVTNTAMTSYSRSDESAPTEAADLPEGAEAVDREGNQGNEEPDREYTENEGGGEGSEGGYQGQLSDQRFVLLTDLGVVEKIDVGLTHWVYVQSFRTGAPVGSAQIEVLAKNGSILMRRATDANGVVTLPSLKDFTAEKTPVALVVRRDGDVSFLPLNRSDRSLDFSRFEVGGVRTHGRTGALSAFAFSDRGLYRPAETAHLTTVVRAVDWSRSVKGTPLLLNVTDPRGLQVALKHVELDAAGLTGLDFRPEESAPTGTYTFNVSVPQPNGSELQLGSATFRVEEFLPDRMRLSTHFEGAAEGWLTGSKLKAVAELRNLFGTPAADHRVEANVTLTPYSPRFSKYPDYQFFDPAQARRSESQSLGESTTNAEGNSEYDVDLSSWAPATWQISFYAEGFELGGGRSVTSLATVIASPRKYMVGFKADGSLGFVQHNSERKVQIIAVDPKLEPLKVEKLKLVLVEQRYVSVLTRASNGSYRYQSVLKDVTRKSDSFAVSEAGTTMKVPSADVGTFYWSVRDVEDVELLRVGFTIAGEANVAKELEKNAELKVSLDKAEYEPGETMTVQITAPYAGAGVITVERDKVFVHKPFKTTTSSTVQSIEVPAGLEVNGYVNVSFVRAIDSPELYVSPLSYGVVPFTVLKKSQHLQLTVTAPELTKPGRPMTIKYKTDRPSKIVVFAVDEGILQVARYQTPDPLGFFLEKRALEVTTRQIVDLLLPEFRLVHRGKEGGDSDGALARNLNPFKRKSDAPAVFWSGIVDAGPDEKSVSFVVPESFNGSLRVMAVAASAEALAASSSSTTVRGPFVISPNTPTFVSPGDTFSVTAAIANNVEGSGDKTSVTVTMKPSAAFTLAAGAQTTQTLIIAERREGVVSFDVKATEVLGDGELQFQVSGAKQEVTRTAHVSVRPSSAYLVSTSTGTVRGASAELSTKRIMFDQFATRRLTVSLLPMGLSAGLLDYLGSYPHLCSEQLTSRAVPGLVLMKRPEWGYDSLAAKASFDTAFNVLRARQNDQGQFGYWAANSFVYPTLDVFITLMLTEAKERGVASPNDVRLKAIGNLKQDQLPVDDMARARLRAQTLYVLARNAVVSPAPTAQLAEFLGRQQGAALNDVALAFLAATYQLTNNPQRAQELIKKFSLSDDVVPEANVGFDNTVYQAQVLYLMSKHFPERLEGVGPKVLSNLGRTMTSSGLHSLGASWSLYALDAYSTAMQDKVAGLKGVRIEVKDAAGAFKEQEVTGTLTAKVAFTAAATGFKVTAPEGVLLFFSVVESGFDKAVPTTSINDGVEVMHTFENGAGKTVTTATLGEELIVHLRVRTLDKYSQVPNVALIDLLPSGFEVVQNRSTDLQGLARLTSGGSTWQPDSLDIREDRVNFYGTITNTVQELKYKIKAVAKGTFVVPPAQAVGMYRPDIRGRSTGGSVVVQ